MRVVRLTMSTASTRGHEPPGRRQDGRARGDVLASSRPAVRPSDGRVWRVVGREPPRRRQDVTRRRVSRQDGRAGREPPGRRQDVTRRRVSRQDGRGREPPGRRGREPPGRRQDGVVSRGREPPGRRRVRPGAHYWTDRSTDRTNTYDGRFGRFDAARPEFRCDIGHVTICGIERTRPVDSSVDKSVAEQTEAPMVHSADPRHQIPTGIFRPT